MARSSRKRDRGAASALIFLVVAGLVFEAVVQIRHQDYHTGIKFIAWSCIALALVLGFVLPVRCNAKTTRSTPCGNTAYGLLFGCTKTAGHWSGKFLARFRSQRKMPQKVPQGRRGGSYAVMYHVTAGSEPLRVTVEDGMLTKCGFWVAVVSAVAGVAQVILTIH